MILRRGGRAGSDAAARKETNMSLVIESYDEIFSSFDPRPYESKPLSIDFLDECKRAARDKGDEIELRLLVPKEKRNMKYELMIRKRLKEHFQKHLRYLEMERKKIFRQGLYFIGFGMLFMFVAAYILFYYGTKQNLTKELLIVLLQPGGWFLFWEGLNLMIFESKKVSPDLDFYRKMANSTVYFLDY
jgi:hypothetical protein